MQKEMYRDLERVFSTSTRIDFNGEERNGTWADFKTNYGLDLPCHAEVKHFDGMFQINGANQKALIQHVVVTLC